MNSGSDNPPIRIVHVIGPLGNPTCPKCGKGLEEDGGSVYKCGSMDHGPLFWWCGDCDHQWGHA